MADWSDVLGVEKQQDYFVQLMDFVKQERNSGKVIYPPHSEMFSTFRLTPFAQVKVVILGQDPYHGPNQANGLAFSVAKGVALPPSLRNIFQEIEADLGCSFPPHGDLTHWAKQGVLLLNAVLSVQAGAANSHKDKGWETFTDRTIEILNQAEQHIVFLLWGAYAQKKAVLIDPQKHSILKAPHPSPLSAHRGYFGCRHFSKANQLLQQHQQQPIDWAIT